MLAYIIMGYFTMLVCSCYAVIFILYIPECIKGLTKSSKKTSSNEERRSSSIADIRRNSQPSMIFKKVKKSFDSKKIEEEKCSFCMQEYVHGDAIK